MCIFQTLQPERGCVHESKPLKIGGKNKHLKGEFVARFFLEGGKELPWRRHGQSSCNHTQ